MMKNNISDFLSSANNTFNKAFQLAEEKLTNAEITQYDPEVQCSINRADSIQKNVNLLINNASCLVFPNPASAIFGPRALRAELALTQLIKTPVRESQPSNSEVLGNQFKEIGNYAYANTDLGNVLTKIGQTEIDIGVAEKQFQESVVQKFIDPLKVFLAEDCKCATDSKKKLENARVELDVAKRQLKSAHVEKKKNAEQVVEQKQAIFEHQMAETMAEEKKFEEKFIHNIQPLLKEFVKIQLAYHKSCASHLTELDSGLNSSQFTNSQDAEDIVVFEKPLSSLNNS